MHERQATLSTPANVLATGCVWVTGLSDWLIKDGVPFLRFSVSSCIAEFPWLPMSRQLKTHQRFAGVAPPVAHCQAPLPVNMLITNQTAH